MGRVAESLSIVFPMWNEESSIHLAVDSAREAGDALVAHGEIDRYEIVIVDDASTDATPELAATLAATDDRIRVVRHKQNRGLGGSIKTGLATAAGDVVLYTDADLPCDLLDSLSRAMRLMRIYSADIVSAYRHDRTGEGPRRAVYTLAYNSMIQLVFGLRVRDVNFAFKLFRRPVLEHVTPEADGSFIDAEILIRAHRLGFHIIQFGVDYFPRTRGVSTLSSGPTILKIVRELRSLRPRLTSIDPLPPDVLAALTADHHTEPTAPLRHRRRQRRPSTPDASSGTGRDRLLIVNADDYGLTECVSRGILRAHHEGIVTSTSVLALAPGFATSGKWLADEDALGVGVHLALVGEDPPLLSAAEIPSLVDRRGRLAPNWRVFLARAGAGRVDAVDVARELQAQVDAVRRLGVPITHLDSHQHLHLWPLVRDVVLDLAVREGIGAIRVPRAASAFPGAGVNLLSQALARRATAAGLAFPQHAVGVDEAGRMHGDRLIGALDRLASSGAATAELSAHPGGSDDPARDRYRWNYAWSDELASLVAPATRAAVTARGFTLGTYGDLATRSAAGRSS